MPKYPKIKVRLIGADANAFSIITKVSNALQRNSVDEKEIDEFKEEAMSGDYNHLLRTVMKWVNVR